MARLEREVTSNENLRDLPNLIVSCVDLLELDTIIDCILDRN